MNQLATRNQPSFGSIGAEAQHYLRLSIATALDDLKRILNACAWHPMFVDFSSSFRKAKTYVNQSHCQRSSAASRR